MSIEHRDQPTAEYRFFVYDAMDGAFVYFRSIADRDAVKDGIIQSYLDDGWSEDVERVMAGEVTHTCQMIDVQQRPPQAELDAEGCDGAGVYWDEAWSHRCNYDLLPLAVEPLPVTASTAPHDGGHAGPAGRTLPARCADMSENAKRLTPAEVEAGEKRLVKLIAAIGKSDSDEDREDATWYARRYLERLLESGYSAVAGEGQALRIRKASAEVAQRLNQVEPPAAALNVHGFAVPLFKVRLQRLQAVLSNYSPAEFARECARLARSADPRVLAEDEFQ